MMGVILHRYEETGAILPNGQPRLRIVESGTFEPGHPDNPEWAVEALGAREATSEATPRVTPWESTADPQPWAVINAVPFNVDTEAPEAEDDVEDDDETVVDDEPEPATVIDPEGHTEEKSVPVPSKGGAGSGRDAWVAYAEANDVEVTPEMTRDDIVAACEAANVPTE